MDQPPPWEALPIAALISILAAALSFPYKYIRCWTSWSGAWGFLWMFGYLLVAGAFGGGFGWLLGWLTNFQPTPNVWINGIFYGAAGALAIGAQVKGQPKSSKGPGELRDVQSLLLRMLSRIEQTLDELTRECAKTWLKGQKSSREIALAASDIKAYILNEESLKAQRNKLLESLTSALESLANATKESEIHEHQGKLIEFSSRFYVQQHIPKPKLVMPAGVRARPPRKEKATSPKAQEPQPASTAASRSAARPLGPSDAE